MWRQFVRRRSGRLQKAGTAIFTELVGWPGIMRQLVDGHVMIETLRECPLAENSLEREYERSSDAMAKHAIG